MSSFRVLLLVSLAAGLVQSAHAQLTADQMRACTSFANQDDRNRCEREISSALATAGRSADLGFGWTLARSKSLTGESNLSVMHVSDATKSDPDFAGLSFRCGPKDIETTLILLGTLPQEARAPLHVRVKTTSGEHEFEASLTSGGQMILLPPGAAALATSDWARAAELSIEIRGRTGSTMKGAVPIAGLSQALNTLRAGCMTGKP